MRCLRSPVSAFSFSLNRQPSVYILFSSRFTSCNKQHQAISSTASKGQVLLHSLETCSTRSVFRAPRLSHNSSSVRGTLCAAGSSLSKTNQAVTSNSIPNANPCNIDLLRAKHPDPAHPDRDLVSLSSKLWPRAQNLEEYWSPDAGAEFLDKWFSIPKTCQYFRTV
jgi:hypothetical protein